MSKEDEALDKMAENARELGLDYEPAQQEPVKFKCTVIDDAHPDGIPLSQWGQQGSVTAAQKDEVFTASIEFIGTLTGMQPPPIEVAPLEILKPFRDFTEKVCSIFATSPPAQRTWVGLTPDELNAIFDSMKTWSSFQITDVYFAIEAKLKEKNT
jgi:hypothetical protein